MTFVPQKLCAKQQLGAPVKNLLGVLFFLYFRVQMARATTCVYHRLVCPVQQWHFIPCAFKTQFLAYVCQKLLHRGARGVLRGVTFAQSFKHAVRSIGRLYFLCAVCLNGFNTLRLQKLVGVALFCKQNCKQHKMCTCRQHPRNGIRYCQSLQTVERFQQKHRVDPQNA